MDADRSPDGSNRRTMAICTTRSRATGPGVTFLHPGLWDSRTWDPQFAVLGGPVPLLRYDLRGYGRSSRLDGCALLARPRSRGAARSRGVERTALVGCSMGGGVAIDFTLEHPERVRRWWRSPPRSVGFEALEEEEAWWDERAAPIEAAIEAGDHPRRSRRRARDLGAAGDRRRGGPTDPRDRDGQHPRAHDGRERDRGARPSRRVRAR